MKILALLTLTVLGFAFTSITPIEAATTTKKALVVVSFGTTFKETRELDVEGVENALMNAFPDRDFRRAFTSKIVMKRLSENDNIKVDDLNATLEKLKKEGYNDILIQPTHLTPGEEIANKVMPAVNEYKNKFNKIVIGKPLLTDERDFPLVARALQTNFPQLRHNEMLVFMGHGSPHQHNPAYNALEKSFKELNMPVIIGVVEETDNPNYEDMLKNLKASNKKNVLLMPLMIVAGDHANNDMVGDDEDSWKSMLTAEGFDIRFVLKGIGRNVAIQNIYVLHALEALNN